MSEFTPGHTIPTATLNGMSRLQAIIFDASGNLFVADSHTNDVYKFAPGATTPSATLTGLSYPVAMAFDAQGNLYVANEDVTSTVSKFAPGATTPSATLTGLSHPTALAFDSSGNLYVANQVQTGTVSKFAPGATTPSVTLTGLNYPIDLAFDASGNLYASNYNGNTVSKFAPGATVPSATLNGLSNPNGLAVDASGNLYVANWSANTVSKFAPGTTTPTATLTGLNAPWQLAFNSSGNLYVTNQGLNSGTTVSVFANPAAPSNINLTVSSYTVSDGNNGRNYAVTTVVNTTGLITPPPLTITATANTKKYDATTTVAVTPTVTGLYGADSVTGLVEVFSDKNVGSNKTLSVYALTVNDNNHGNNYLVTTVTNTAGIITTVPLSIAATAVTKTYDASTGAAAAPTVSGLVGTDTVGGLGEMFSDPNAGTNKTINVTAYAIFDGDGGKNYAISLVPATTGVVNKAALTLSAQTNTKTYDAATSATAAPTVAGLKGNNTVTNLAEAYTDLNAGTTKTLSVSAYTINDANGGNNYAITTVSNNTGVINKAALMITASANTKTYDSTTNASVIPTVSGLKGSDTATGLAEVYTNSNTGAARTLSVTAYTINDGNNGNNYGVATASNPFGVINKAYPDNCSSNQHQNLRCHAISRSHARGFQPCRQRYGYRPRGTLQRPLDRFGQGPCRQRLYD